MKTKRLFLFLSMLAFVVVLAACQTTTTTTTTTTSNPTTTSTTTSSTTTTSTTSASTTTTTTTTTASTTTTTTTIPLPVVYPLVTGWSDPDGVHVITYGSNRMDVAFNKNGFSWAAMTKEITESLARFNKLVFTVSGSGSLMIKIQGETSAIEVSVPVTAGAVTYQLNLRDDDAFLAGVSQILLFAAPGKAQGEGTIAITKLEFDEGTAFGNVLEKGENRIPQNQLVYDGTGETFDFAVGFEDNGDGVYTVDKTNGKVVVSYDKQGFSWAFMLAQMSGKFSDFNYVVLEVKGITAGQVMLKAELPGLAVEKGVSFAADETVKVFIDISTWTTAQRDAINKILVFASGGNTTATGTFEVLGAYFAKTVELDPPYNFNEAWVENDPSTYTFVPGANNSVVVNYTKGAGQEWAFMKNDLDPEKVLGLNTMTIVVKGTPGKKILIKPNDSNDLQKEITFADTAEVTFVATANVFTKILIFAEPNVASVSGSFEIVSLGFSYVLPDAVDPSVVVDFRTGWIDNDGDLFTFADTAGKTVVTYNKPTSKPWSFIIRRFAENLSNHNTITLTVKGEAGKEILVKPNDKGMYEKTITFTGEEQTVVFTLEEAPKSVLIFADPFKESLTGTFEIIKAEVSYVGPAINYNTGWVDNEPGTYAISTTATGSILVNYTKGATQAWAFMRKDFEAGSVNGLNVLTMVVKGTPGKRILIKPNDNGALEKWITFADENPVTVTVKADAFTTIILFGEPELGNVTGSFEILSVNLTYEPAPAVDPSVVVDFRTGWVDNDGGLFTFTDTAGKTVVAYDKPAGKSWAYIVRNFSQNLANHNTITLIVKGEAGKEILVKPNDKGIFEKTITFTGEEQTVVITLTEAPTRVLIFADPFKESLTGTFEIIKAEVSFVSPVINYNVGWVDNEPGTYAITTTATGSVLVNYTKGATQAWAYMRKDFEAGSVDGLNVLTMVVKGTPGKRILIKPNDNGALEKWITFTDENPVTVTVKAEAFTKIILFGEPELGNVTGSFEILSVNLSYEPAPAVDPSVVVDFTTGWKDNGDGLFTINETTGKAVISYNKPARNDWTYIVNNFAQDLANHNTITLVVKGEVGKEILVKPNDKGIFEKTITFTGAEQTVVFTLNETPTKVLIFADPFNGSLTGSFEIIKAEVSYVDPTLKVFDFSTKPFLTFNGMTATVAMDGAAVNVSSFTKTAFNSVLYFHLTNLGDVVLTEYDYINLVIESDNVSEFLITLGNVAAMDHYVQVVNGRVELTLSLKSLMLPAQITSFQYVNIRPMPNSANATGSFKVVKAEFSTKPMINYAPTAAIAITEWKELATNFQINNETNTISWNAGTGTKGLFTRVYGNFTTDGAITHRYLQFNAVVTQDVTIEFNNNGARYSVLLTPGTTSYQVDLTLPTAGAADLWKFSTGFNLYLNIPVSVAGSIVLTNVVISPTAK